MKILTFYSELSHPLQKKCINFWYKSWKEKNFTPALITPEHPYTKGLAESHPYYSEFVKSINEIHQEIMEVPCRPYGMACYLRWLAYDMYLEKRKCDDLVFVSDYDVLNVNFDVNEAEQWLKGHENNLHFYHGCTPCLASGKLGLFTEFAKKIVSVSQENIELLKYTIGPHYNDQEFIENNRSDLFKDDKFSMETGHHYNRLVFDFSGTSEDFSKKTIHFSHAFCDAALNRLNVKRSHSEMNLYRTNFIQAFLSMFDSIQPTYIKSQEDYEPPVRKEKKV